MSNYRYFVFFHLNKNIKKINGKHLIYYPFNAAKKSKFIDKIYLNTDTERIIKIARSYKIKNIFKREKKLGGNKVKIHEVLINQIKKLSLDSTFDFMILLEPTSPLTTYKDIDKAIKKIIDNKFSSLISISSESIPNLNYEVLLYKNKIKFKNKDLIKLQNRQNFEKKYFACGTLYITKIKSYFKYKNFLQDKTGFIEVDKNKMFEIDDEIDFKIVKMLLEN